MPLKQRKPRNSKHLNDFYLKKICMYVYEIFPKYTWNINVFITYKVF